MVAPATPLFPASAAATPSISPLPKFSGFSKYAALQNRQKADGSTIPGMPYIRYKLPFIMIRHLEIF